MQTPAWRTAAAPAPQAPSPYPLLPPASPPAWAPPARLRWAAQVSWKESRLGCVLDALTLWERSWASVAHRRAITLRPLVSDPEHPPSEHAPLAAARTLYPAADAMRRQTVATGMTSTSPAATAAAAKPAVVLLPARSASDHPASWSIHAFDASSASSTPISCPGTPAAKTPSAAPNSLGSACPSGSSSSSTGECRGVQGKAW